MNCLIRRTEDVGDSRKFEGWAMLSFRFSGLKLDVVTSLSSAIGNVEAASSPAHPLVHHSAKRQEPHLNTSSKTSSQQQR
jgi:hypothetical protein